MNNVIGLKSITKKLQSKIDCLMKQPTTKETLEELNFLVSVTEDITNIREVFIKSCMENEITLEHLYIKIGM